jgi:hypothetical protein
MANKLLSIAVVGHTNAGKTSLLRTLTRNKRFGEVSPRNATTKYVSKTSVIIAGEPRLNLFDTPGFEDSNAFREYVRQFEGGGSRQATLRAFLSSPEADGIYEQQAKVVRTLLDKIDVVFYVIDCTEQPLPKYLCELDVLAMCGRPVLPVLNFVSDNETYAESWSATLADRGLHIKVSFDAVTPKFGSEPTLYKRLGALLEDRQKELDDIAAGLADESETRRMTGLTSIAGLLVDAAAYRAEVQNDDEAAKKVQAKRMQDQLRQAEQSCVKTLLEIFSFDRDDLADTELPVMNSSVEDDLFNPEAFKAASTRLGIGAVIGTAIGLGIDIALIGGSLGAGAVAGGAIGGAIAGYAKELYGWARAKYLGLVYFSFDDTTLAILMDRQLQLLTALQHRTHASQVALTRGSRGYGENAWSELTTVVTKIRAHPEWCGIGGEPDLNIGRDEAIRCIRDLYATESSKIE